MSSQDRGYRLTKKDKKVIDAFTSQQSMRGNKLESTGDRLDGLWMGGRGLAEWRDGKVVLPDTGGGSITQRIQNAVRSKTPRNLLAR